MQSSPEDEAVVLLEDASAELGAAVVDAFRHIVHERLLELNREGSTVLIPRAHDFLVETSEAQILWGGGQPQKSISPVIVDSAHMIGEAVHPIGEVSS